MKSQKSTKKYMKIKIQGVILISLMLLSTIAIIPQVNARPLMETINQKEEFIDKVDQIQFSMEGRNLSDTSLITNLLISLLWFIWHP